MTDPQAVARGDRPADLAVTGGRVYQPETREFVARDVLVADGTVAALVPDADDYTDDDTQVVDATDRVVAPGFIDAHTHLDLHQTIEAAYPHHLLSGTTTLVSEVAATGAVFGPDAVREFLAAAADTPLTVKALVPPGPLLDAYEPPRADTADDYVACLDEDGVLGVGELSWTNLVGDLDRPLADLYDAAHDRDAIVGAHGAGCRGRNLQSLAHVATDDHEAISADGHVERVAAGIHAIGRSGSIRDDADALAGALDDLDASELSLSTDGAWPRMLLNDGSMDAAIRNVIDAGADPRDVLRCATLTPARHFDLDDKGSLAPGNDADLVVLESIDDVDVATVVVDGNVVVHNHQPAVSPHTHDYPDRFLDSVHVDLTEDAFRVPAGAAPDGVVNAIRYERGLLSDATTVEPPERDGELHAAPEHDVLKVALVDRHPDTDRGHFTGFLTGFGLDDGAVATTLTWETAGVLVVGTNDADMHAAVDAVRDAGGGWAVVHDHDVVARLPTPVAGFCSTRSVEETAKLEGGVRDALRRLGAHVDRPLLALQTLTFFGVPDRKLTFSGYAEIRAGGISGLTPE